MKLLPSVNGPVYPSLISVYPCHYETRRIFRVYDIRSPAVRELFDVRRMYCVPGSQNGQRSHKAFHTGHAVISDGHAASLRGGARGCT